MPVGLEQVSGVEAMPFLKGFSGGKGILRFLVPPLARLAAVIAPPPELLELDELLEDELELLEEELELLEDELELELELRPLELELLELELLELEPLEVSPPQPNRLSTGMATAVVLMMRTILRRDAVAVVTIDSSVVVVIVCTI